VVKILVCGGRTYSDLIKIEETILSLMSEFDLPMIIHGGAKGADTKASDIATLRGLPVAEVKANWDYWGKRAGPLRNQWMLWLEPNLVVAFPGGRGTADMVQRAERAGIEVRRIGW
jgi:hypothetical protein